MRTYKSIKCSYNNCPNEAVGYICGANYGLWVCENHGGLSTPCKILVADIKKEPNHPNRWRLKDTFEEV